MGEGSWVGLHVHARSVVAGVIDQGSGEVRSLRVPLGYEETVAWLKTLSAPVRVVYEAGPTGYGLARACADAGISCVVAAPSRIRPAADRVKTDRRDAERLARLLRLGEITPVRVPAPEEEAARDLVRAREDARGDLMRARTGSRSCCSGMGWCTTGPRGRARTMLASPAAAPGWAARDRVRRVLRADARREDQTRRARQGDRRARRRAAVRRRRRAARLSARRLTLTAFALTVELGDWHRFRPRSLGPFLGLTPSEHSSGERRRQGAITKAGNCTCAGFWSRPPGTSAARPHERHAGTQTQGKSLAVRAQADRSARRLHGRWHALEPRGSLARSSWSPSRASWLGTAGRWRRWSSRRVNGTARRAHRRNDARSDPRERCEQPAQATLDARERHRSSFRTPGHAAPTAHMSRDTNVDDSRCALPADRAPQSRAANPCAVDRPHSI